MHVFRSLLKQFSSDFHEIWQALVSSLTAPAMKKFQGKILCSLKVRAFDSFCELWCSSMDPLHAISFTHEIPLHVKWSNFWNFQGRHRNTWKGCLQNWFRMTEKSAKNTQRWCKLTATIVYLKLKAVKTAKWKSKTTNKNNDNVNEFTIIISCINQEYLSHYSHIPVCCTIYVIV